MGAPSDTKCEQPPISVDERESVTLAEAAFSSELVHQDEWKVSEHASRDETSEKVSEHASRNTSEKVSSEEWHDRDEVLRNRLAWIFLIVMVVGLSAILATTLWQRVQLNAESLQALKPPDRPTRNGAPENSSVVATKIA